MLAKRSLSTAFAHRLDIYYCTCLRHILGIKGFITSGMVSGRANVIIHLTTTIRQRQLSVETTVEQVLVTQALPPPTEWHRLLVIQDLLIILDLSLAKCHQSVP